jgi:phage FluMu protein Com
MQCTKCGSNKVLVEATGSGGSRRTCQECAHVEVVNRDGQKLLTDEMPTRPQVRVPRPLMEG